MRRSKVAMMKTRPYLRVPAGDAAPVPQVLVTEPQTHEEIQTEDGIAITAEDAND